MTKRLLISGPPVSSDFVGELTNLGFSVVNGTEAAFRELSVPSSDWARDLTENELVEVLKGVSVYIYGGLEVASAAVLERIQDLRLIAFLGTGWSDPGCVDADAARRSKITVTNTPGANAPSVAEATIGLMLALQRQVVHLNNQSKGGSGRPVRLRDVAGRRLGIVGLGTIGTLVARHVVRGFGMDVVYVGPNPKPKVEQELGVRRVGLEELLRTSDFVTLHSPARETVGLIGRQELSMMRPTAFLLNLCSPEVVDGYPLVEALEVSSIAGAGYDGWYKEPEDLRKRFLAVPDDRLIVLPRSAWLTDDSYARMLRMAVDGIRAFSLGKRPATQVSP